MRLYPCVLLFCLLNGVLFGSERLNVLFIIADDLNCDMGVYGHPLVQTPNLDKLAANGLTFDYAYCNYPQCGSSRASFMTGLYPEQNGVVLNTRLFRNYVPEALTLSQHFMDQGYTAARVGKLYHYDNPGSIGANGHDDPASWDIRVNPRGIDKDIEDAIFTLREGNYGSALSWLAAPGEDEEHTDGIVATEAIRLLERFAAEDEPFFLAVGFYRPHVPFVTPKRYFDLYDLADLEAPRVPTGYYQTLPLPAARSLRFKEYDNALSEQLAREALQGYYASITFLDAQVGRVLRGLEESGLADNTIVLFTSDHGYHMGEKGHYMKMTLFENADRVPLILSAPGMKARGQRTRTLFEMIDFYRTLSDLANVAEPPAYVQGLSQAAVLDNHELGFRESAYTQHGKDGGYTIRTHRYRYTQWPHHSGPNEELYDHLNDPEEMMNLASDPIYRDNKELLRQEWEARVADATTPVEGLEFTPPAADDRGIPRREYMRMEAEGRLPMPRKR